jgi:glycosyltransferase involved in cell wall biosynthesis
MRVLQVIDKSFVGGGQQVVRSLVDGLQRAGDHVSVACAGGGPLVDSVRALGAQVHEVPFDKRFRLGPSRQVAAIARRIGADIVHSHGLVATTYCAAARAMFQMRLPVLYHQHGFHHHNYGAATVGLRKSVERAICKRVDRVIAASEADVDALVSGGYANRQGIEIVRYGLNVRIPSREEIAAARAAADLDEGVPVVGLVARLHPQKGVDVFLEAAALVHRSVPKVAFVVVGDGELRATLHDLARTLGVPVRWMGTNPIERFVPLFTVGVLSSRWEGLPLTLLEFMAAGLPTVTTDLPNYREAVDARHVRLVPSERPSSMAAAIVELLEHPARARALGDAARQRFQERFTLDVMIRRCQSIYAEVRR